MPNYRETPVAGTQWQRSNQVRVDNPYGGQPTVHFVEEQIVTLGADQFARAAGELSFPFDPAEQIDLINPADDSPLGQSVSGMEVYVLLYSLYRKHAALRDAPEPTP